MSTGADAPLRCLMLVASERDGGVVRSCFLLARYLPEFGVEPLVVSHTKGPFTERLAAHGMPFEVVPGLPLTLMRRARDGRRTPSAPLVNALGLPTALLLLRELARDHRAKLLYSHGTWPAYAAAAAAAAAGHDSQLAAVWHVRGDHSRPLTRTLVRAIAHTGAVRAVIAVSASAAEPYRGLPVRVEVIPNGADPEASARARRHPTLRARLGVGPEVFLAGYAGRLVPHKGVAVLFDAAERAMARWSTLHLVVFGENPAHLGHDFLGELGARARAAGIADRVHLLGFADDIEPLLAGLDVAVLPSLFPEPAGRSTIEAMAMGVPVIASRIGGIPEYVRDEVDGLLVPPGDARALAHALLTLASDPALRARMAAAAQLGHPGRPDAREVARRVADVLRASV